MNKFGERWDDTDTDFRWTISDLQDLNNCQIPKITGIRTKGGYYPGLTAIQLLFENEISSPVFDTGRTKGVGEFQTYPIK